MARQQSDGFLGRGLRFPLQKSRGGLQTRGGEEKIRESIYIILMTRQGERPMRPDFGSRIWDYVFSIPSETYENLLCAEIEQAVLRWEHRVDNVRAKVDTSEAARGKLTVDVSYTVRATNRPDNLVFPFYLEEGDS